MSWLHTAFASMALLGFSALSASAAVSTPREWTILVFLNANNNLDSFSYDNMNAMETVGSTDQVNVVVQVTHRNAKKTLRYLMKKDADKKNVTSPVVETLAKVDMGSDQTLTEFLAWGMKKYPAKHYMVDIWNHGSGWEKRARTGVVRGISYDDSTGNHITTPQLGAVMAQAAATAGSQIELIGFDACLMQMCEVASEISESVKFSVGSEEVEPGAGWPYAAWLKWVTTHADADGAGVGQALVEAFRASYDGGENGSESTTLSVVDLSKIDAVSAAADAFAAALLADRAHRKELVAGIQASQSFEEPTHHDLVDLVDQVTKRVANDAVKSSGAALKAAAAAMIVASAHTGEQVAHASGLAIWAPTSGGAENLQDYEELRWAKQGQWDAFVAALVSGKDRDLLRAQNGKALFGE